MSILLTFFRSFTVFLVSLPIGLRIEFVGINLIKVFPGSLLIWISFLVISTSS